MSERECAYFGDVCEDGRTLRRTPPNAAHSLLDTRPHPSAEHMEGILADNVLHRSI